MENKVIAMFNMAQVKARVRDCPVDEIIILCPHWSINKPKYEDAEDDPESEQRDLDEFEEELGVSVLVSDYDDLVADPNGIYS